MKTSKPFGMWASPISASQISQGLQLIDVRWDQDGRTLVWVEGRSGQNHLMSQASGDSTRELTTGASVSGGIGYGGGEFDLARGTLVYATREGPLFRRSLGQDQSRQITPSFGACASATISPDGNWVAYIFSDGKTDLLGLVDSQGQDWPLKLAQGADFYMQPAWHPAGDRLAWIEWNHPNMPWDGTRLQIATLAGSPPRIVSQNQLAGDDDIPVSQPTFSPDGKFLSYIEAAGEWERLVVLDLSTNQKRILVEGSGFNLSQPAWVQGRRSCAWSWTSQRLFYIRYSAGQAALWQVELASGHSEQIDCAPYTSISQLSAAPGSDELAFLASAPSVPTRVVRWDGSSLHIVERSDPEDIPAEFFPTARPVTWNSPDGMPVHGIYYPPTNPNYSASGLPPAIVHIHGGPTDQASIEYAPGIAYFTSRGYAWLDVNYRGSTGYGRSYQAALRQHWGDIDVVDAAGGALALAELGLANPRQIVIHGGSAGGYTVLNALIHHPDVFKAGVCLYGVSNLFLLDLETHKFEAHYTASLVGELPAAADRYHAWSPVFHAHLIRSPLAVFQGAEDKVVPPDQSEAIVAVLRVNAVPHLYKLYPGEGHGFRKSATILDYLQQVERFLQMHVLFAP